MVKTFRKLEVRHKLVNLKVTQREYDRIQMMAEKYAAGNMSAWLRAVGMSEPSEYLLLRADDDEYEATHGDTQDTVLRRSQGDESRD